MMNSDETTHDISGYAIFSTGSVGAAHVMTHRMLDDGNHALGHKLLGAWLEGRTGEGSKWTHLQWHMMVFEIAVGRWRAAYRRFAAEILPVAESSDDALTDAPAALWRLQLSAPHGFHVSLPWDAVRRRALANIDASQDPFVVLHDLLALAGAGDVQAIDAWLGSGKISPSIQRLVLRQLALGLRAFALEDYAGASAKIAAALNGLHLVGGSHAQAALFVGIRDEAKRRAERQDAPPPSKRAA